MSVLAPSLRGYKPAWLRNDLVAGATVWAVLIPEALAYATIAGAPPVVGLYAAAPALVLYAMFGSSRHLVVGPMSATAALSAGTIATVADPSGSNYVALTAALAHRHVEWSRSSPACCGWASSRGSSPNRSSRASSSASR